MAPIYPQTYITSVSIHVENYLDNEMQIALIFK